MRVPSGYTARYPLASALGSMSERTSSICPFCVAPAMLITMGRGCPDAAWGGTWIR